MRKTYPGSFIDKVCDVTTDVRRTKQQDIETIVNRDRNLNVIPTLRIDMW